MKRRIKIVKLQKKFQKMVDEKWKYTAIAGVCSAVKRVKLRVKLLNNLIN